MVLVRLQAGSFPTYKEASSMDASYLAAWPPRRRRNQWPVRKTCCGWPGCPRGRNQTTPLQACYARWAVGEMGWTQTNTANLLGLSQGTVSRIMQGVLFPSAPPLPIPGFSNKGCARSRQSELRF